MWSSGSFRFVVKSLSPPCCTPSSCTFPSIPSCKYLVASLFLSRTYSLPPSTRANHTTSLSLSRALPHTHALRGTHSPMCLFPRLLSLTLSHSSLFPLHKLFSSLSLSLSFTINTQTQTQYLLPPSLPSSPSYIILSLFLIATTNLNEERFLSSLSALPSLSSFPSEPKNEMKNLPNVCVFPRIHSYYNGYISVLFHSEASREKTS